MLSPLLIISLYPHNTEGSTIILTHMQQMKKLNLRWIKSKWQRQANGVNIISKV